MTNTITEKQDNRSMDKKLSDFINYWDYKLGKPTAYFLSFITLLVIISLPIILITQKSVWGLLAIIPAIILSIRGVKK